MDAARALAARVAKNPPGVLRMTKRLLREGQHASLATLLEMSAAFQAIVDLKVPARDTVTAIDAIVRLNAELERWPEVEEGLRRLLTLADDDETRASLLGRTAAVVGDKLGRYPDAIDLLEVDLPRAEVVF